MQYAAAFFLTAVLLSGCGGEEQLSNTKQGMNAVEALQYEEALAQKDAELENQQQQYEEKITSLQQQIETIRDSLN